MDEPLTNLDAALRADMRVELKRLQADLHTTMVYVTHDQTEAMSMAHRIAVMNQAVLQQVGTALEVYDKPETLFVAGFIGTPPMNFVRCHRENGHLIDKSGAFNISTSLTPEMKSAVDASGTDEFVFGARSEDITITPAGADDSTPGRISVRELLGDEIIYDVLFGDSEIRVKTEPTLLLEPDENIGLKFNPERVHLFDAVTEKNIL
jgi:ABC-type sugar transport system ATPase subunit